MFIGRRTALTSSGLLLILFVLSFNLDKGTAGNPIPPDIKLLLTRNTCISCHQPYTRLVGPSFQGISKRRYTPEKIAQLVATPQPADWPGFPPMAPLKNVPFEDIKKIHSWMERLYAELPKE